MQTVLNIGKWSLENYQLVISASVALLSGVIAVCLLIPGDQPETFLQSIVDFLAKFSVKPKGE